MDIWVYLALVIGAVTMYFMLVSIIEAWFTAKERYIDHVITKMVKGRKNDKD